MCRWLAYKGNPILMEKLVFEPKYSLIDQSIHARKSKMTLNGDGFGLGWYGCQTEPGLYREVIPAWNDENLKSLCHQIKSALFFAHVRASTGTSINRSNCHPFKYRNWLFMHNGQIGGYGQLKRQLDYQIPDDLYPFRLGSTDSELLFMLLIKYGLEIDPQQALIKTITHIQNLMAKASVTEPFRFTAVCTNGLNLIAVRFSSDNKAPSLFYQQSEQGISIVSEPLDENYSDWTMVKPDSIITIDKDNALTAQAIHSLIKSIIGRKDRHLIRWPSENFIIELAHRYKGTAN